MKTSTESSNAVQYTPLVNLSPEQFRWIRNIIWAEGSDEENRLERFLNEVPRLAEDAWWYAFRLAYEMSRVKKKCYKRLLEIVKEKTLAGAMMEKREKEAYASLPKVVTLYKVMREKQWQSREVDLSWYLTEKRAIDPPYHHRHRAKQKEQKLYVIQVHKKDVIALLNNRRQGEVLLHCKGVRFQALSKEIF